ncbi:hypothetical protein O3M35_000053 [Rhynocoris fuscipes]|uniref:ditrans,polycis-polyprenyl diphosphate synthase [(2E,6E)-farnesyldiphosphate specific] n=1 Tax=Rhynocoris fuscipes TaxID=488301 RepID=A0AAW1DME3_9HEMI
MTNIISSIIVSNCLKAVNTFINLVFLYLSSLLLAVLHNVYNIVFILMKSYDQSNYLNASESSLNADIVFIKSKVSSYNKIPSHLVVIIGAESPSYVDLVKLIVWSVPLGISHISFYDHKNTLNAQALFEKVSKYGQDYIPKLKWGKAFSENIKGMSRKLINGYCWTPQLHVNIYRREDGLENLLETVKCLHRLGTDRVKPQELNDILRGEFQAPEPDLALICGPALSSYGFPPWHLRITLMQSITSHHNLHVSTFLEHIRQYSKSEQRYGK